MAIRLNSTEFEMISAYFDSKQKYTIWGSANNSKSWYTAVRTIVDACMYPEHNTKIVATSKEMAENQLSIVKKVCDENGIPYADDGNAIQFSNGSIIYYE